MVLYPNDPYLVDNMIIPGHIEYEDKFRFLDKRYQSFSLGGGELDTPYQSDMFDYCWLGEIVEKEGKKVIKLTRFTNMFTKWNVEVSRNPETEWSELAKPTFSIELDIISSDILDQITTWDFTFDQNMHLFITYTIGTDVFCYYYNGNDPTTVQLHGLKTNRVRCVLDCTMKELIGKSDIILGYVNLESNKLCYRVQREKYQIEHEIKDVPANTMLWDLLTTDNHWHSLIFQLR